PVEVSAARIHLDQHPAGLATQFVVVLALDAAQALIIHADVAKHLRGQLSLRIEALGFLLEIDALQVQRLDTLRGFYAGFARYPAKRARGLALRENFTRILFRDARDQG